MSLTSFMRQSNTPDYDPVRFGREWVGRRGAGVAPRARDA